MVKLSVVVPVYNAEKYLHECVQSILPQLSEELELVLVNDGSRDNSGRICDAYAKENAYIRVVHQENSGVTAARKAGVRHANGEYIGFLDSDDWVDTDMYLYMLNKIRETSADIAVCCSVRELGNGTSFLLKNDIAEGFYTKDALREKLYPVMLFDFAKEAPALTPSLCNKVFRKKILQNVMDHVTNNVVYGEDTLCSFSCILDSQGIYFTDRAMYHYRENPSSVTNVYDPGLFEKFLLLGRELESQFQERKVNLSKQLAGYMARHSLECIRSELLLNEGQPLRIRRRAASAFVKEPQIQSAYKLAYSEFKNGKTRMKMFLAKNGWMAVLQLLLHK